MVEAEGMPVGKGMMPVIEIGTIPVNAMIIKPSGSKFGLETFAETTFGLGIDVDAFIYVCVHVNCSVVSLEGSGRLKAFCCGNGDGLDRGLLTTATGRTG
jgi:hypothetical protein